MFDEFEEQPVVLRSLPLGSWSTPVQDLVMLLKIVLCVKPQRLLEIGSFRGYTALYLAQHTGPEAKVVAVDRSPSHGEAYCGTPFASKIERRVGELNRAMFANDPPGSYDLVFVDADHSYEGVKRDSELALPLISPWGFIVWHDYANWGYFDGKNGVPEYLGELSLTRPLAHILGSDLAVHSPAWIQGNGQSRYLKAIRERDNEVGSDPWRVGTPRD